MKGKHLENWVKKIFFKKKTPRELRFSVRLYRMLVPVLQYRKWHND